MTRLVLLPRAEDSLNDWHQSEDFFSPNGGQIRANLAPSKRLSVDGIPSPWAARDFMKWRLEDQKSDAGKEAVRIFQTLTLLQFLRLIEGREVALVVGADGIGRLAKVLLRPGHDPDKKITIWKSNLPDLRKYRVVAGSVASCLFFPAAGVDASDLYAALVNSVGPQSPRPMVDKDGNITDGDLAGALAAYLGRLADELERARNGASDSTNALKTWAQALAKLGTAAQPNNQLPINLGDFDGAAIRLRPTAVQRPGTAEPVRRMERSGSIIGRTINGVVKPWRWFRLADVKLGALRIRTSSFAQMVVRVNLCRTRTLVVTQLISFMFGTSQQRSQRIARHPRE